MIKNNLKHESGKSQVERLEGPYILYVLHSSGRCMGCIFPREIPRAKPLVDLRFLVWRACFLPYVQRIYDKPRRIKKNLDVTVVRLDLLRRNVRHMYMLRPGLMNSERLLVVHTPEDFATYMYVHVYILGNSFSVWRPF